MVPTLCRSVEDSQRDNKINIMNMQGDDLLIERTLINMDVEKIIC